MKITRVSGVVYRQQLKPGAPKPKFAGEGRNAFETLLVKVETDTGIVGWGEAFPHRIWPAVKSLLETLIAPGCIGADPADIHRDEGVTAQRRRLAASLSTCR